MIEAAAASMVASTELLEQTGTVSSPVVLNDGVRVNTTTTGWLTALLA